MKTEVGVVFFGSLVALIVGAMILFFVIIHYEIHAANKNQQAVAAVGVVKVLWTDYYRTVIVETPDGNRHRVNFNYRNTKLPVIGETWKVDKDFLFIEKVQ